MNHASLVTKQIKSPLRYPGGKSRAVKQILPIVPEFEEFREPMVGGGSVFFALRQINSDKKFWINDINKDLYLLWKYSQQDLKKLVTAIRTIKSTTKDGKKLYLKLLDVKNLSDFERAVRFFVLNRITFSGTVDSGGYSEQAFKRRFTDSSIDRLGAIAPILSQVLITCVDYEKIIFEKGDKVFIFLDPPYLSTSKSRLYGKNGNLHVEFDHEKFAENMKKCKHNWLITYDNSDEVRKLFSFAYQYEWELQYGMNNYMQKNSKKGKELFISNYEIPLLEKAKIN